MRLHPHLERTASHCVNKLSLCNTLYLWLPGKPSLCLLNSRQWLSFLPTGAFIPVMVAIKTSPFCTRHGVAFRKRHYGSVVSSLILSQWFVLLSFSVYLFFLLEFHCVLSGSAARAALPIFFCSISFPPDFVESTAMFFIIYSVLRWFVGVLFLCFACSSLCFAFLLFQMSSPFSFSFPILHIATIRHVLGSPPSWLTSVICPRNRHYKN